MGFHAQKPGIAQRRIFGPYFCVLVRHAQNGKLTKNACLDQGAAWKSL
jgi:hypothetical protein